MIRTLLIFGILAAGAIGCDDARGNDLLTSAFERCRVIVADIERLSCYDSIGGAVPSVEAEAEAEAVAEIATTTDTQNAQIAEDYGLLDATNAPEVYSVALDRCDLSPNRSFYFYFENGQVWKYVGGKNLRYTKCPAVADITDDRFGYKLRLQGETRWHRIQRKR